MRRLTFGIGAVLASWLVQAPAIAGVPYQVADINRIARPADSGPNGFVSLGSVALFAAADDDSGYEVWRSDGSEAGTYRLLDACPGRCSGYFLSAATTPRGALFVTWVGEKQAALWISDGTASGTTRLAELGGDPEIARVSWVTYVRELHQIFFALTDRARGPELWASDGTAAGTRRVIEASATGAIDPRALTAFGGRLYFIAGRFLAGDLWESDGTRAGTRLVRKIAGRVLEGDATILGVVGTRMLLHAYSEKHGTELWASDGTTAGTGLIVDLVRGPGSLGIDSFRVIGTQAYMTARAGKGDELLVSDGTAKGTKFLSSFRAGRAFGTIYDRLPRRFHRLGDRLLVMADDGRHGMEPWSLDLRTGRLSMIADLCRGICWGSAIFLGGDGTNTWFEGNDGVHGWELWSTDGTAKGTRQVADLCPGACSSDPEGFFQIGARGVLFAHDAGNRYGFWATDGTLDGTAPIADAAIGRSPFGYSVWGGAVAGSSLLFVAADAVHGTEPWVSDGTVAHTRMLMDLATADRGGSWPHRLTAVGDRVQFFADDGIHGVQPWRSDGTASGTELLSVAGEPGSESAMALGSLCLFVRGDRLYRSDGTAGGTYELARVRGYDGPPARGGAVAYFAGEDRALWRTDGSVGGTYRLDDVEPALFDTGSGPALVASGGLFFFRGSDARHGQELWVTDGTLTGTHLVIDMHQDQYGGNPTGITPASGGGVLFVGEDGEGAALWKSDGSEAGTVMLVRLLPFVAGLPGALLGERTLLFAGGGLWASDGTPGGTALVAPDMVPLGGTTAIAYRSRLYFRGPGERLPVLWVSDGTAAGTVPVRDGAGATIVAPYALQVQGDRLYMLARVGEDDAIWVTDGTAGGMRSLAVVGPAVPAGNLQHELAVAANRLFFSADSPEAGNELWALPVP